MKSRITRLITLAAIEALVLVAGCTAGWAQNCPTSPNYSPDFTSNRACLTLNGNASFPASTGGVSTITAWSGTGGTVTFTASNSFIAGEPIILSGFANSTFFNGLAFTVLGTGLSTSQFEIAFSGYTGSSGSDTGAATPLNVLQLTPYTTSQAGSAWYNTSEPVAGGFSTTFTFQLSGAGPSQQGYPNADGIAFVIQNSALTALGPDGCGIGFGDSSSGCAPSTGGIPNSLAVEFNTFFNSGVDQNNNSVSIQSNGTNANCVDPSCTLPGGLNYNLPVTLADGNLHTVTISYALQSTPTESNCSVSGNPGPCLDVIVDGNDLFPAGVAVNLASLLSLINNSTAWVGFTAATGAQYDSQDILNWTFTQQAQSQAGTITGLAPTVYNINGGFGNGDGTGYDATGQLTDPNAPPVNAVITAIPFAGYSSPLQAQQACNAIVQANPIFGGTAGAQCFVYQNAYQDGNGNPVDAPVMLAVTCPPSGPCATEQNPFNADLGTDFNFLFSENPPLTTADTMGLPNLTSSDNLPAVGFLKGSGSDPMNPCSLGTNPPPLFQSNQVSAVIWGGVGVKGGSGGTNSCWIATYQTPGELPTVSVSAPVNNQDYPQGVPAYANYTCTAVNNANVNGGVAGPYLTVPVGNCSATDTPGGSVANGGQFDTTTLGPHTFTATVEDSATNTASFTVTYNVQGSTGTNISSSANPSVYGQSVTFTASFTTVMGSATPTGTVTWSPNTGCGTTAVTAGIATCTTSSLAVGTYTVTGGYSGDTSNSPSGGTLNGGQTVTPASTTTTVGSNLNPSIAGQSVTFTATVAVVSPGVVTPTGTVAWSSNTGCGSTAVSAGIATCTTSSLAVGTDAVTANYSGDATHATSTGSVSGGQVVNSANTTTNVGSSLNPSLSGQSVTFTATVAVVSPGVGTPTGTVAWSSNTGCSTTAVSAGVATCATSSLAVGTDAVTANYNGDSTHGTSNGSVSQVVSPTLTVKPTSMNFGTLYLGQTGIPQLVTVTNPGSTSVVISSVGITGGNAAGDFGDLSFCSPWFTKLPGTLPAGKSCVIGVDAVSVSGKVVSPSAATSYLAITPSGGSAVQVALTVLVINPVASFSATGLTSGKLTFPTTTKNNTSTVSITVKNTGTTPLIFSSPAISGVSAPFSASTTCSGDTVQPNGTCTITVTFAPTANGTFNGTLKVTDNAANSAQTISLSGTT